MKLFAVRGTVKVDVVDLYEEKPVPYMLAPNDDGTPNWDWRPMSYGPPFARIFGWSRLFPSLVIEYGAMKEIEIKDTNTFPGSFKISIYERTPECTTQSHSQSPSPSQGPASCVSSITSPISTPASTSSENNTKL